MIVRKSLLSFLAITLIAATATLTNAQRQSYTGTFRSVQQLISRLDNRTDLLRTSLNAQSQRRAYGTSGQDVEALLNDLDLAVETLQQRFNRRNSTAADAENVLRSAALLEPLMGNEIRGSGVVRHWNALRVDLNRLATAYRISWPTMSQSIPSSGTTYGVNALTGTYRLNTSRSDDPTRSADDAVRSFHTGIDREFVIRSLLAWSRLIKWRWKYEAEK